MAATASPVLAQGILLPPGEVSEFMSKSASGVPGAAQPTQWQLFAPRTELPASATARKAATVEAHATPTPAPTPVPADVPLPRRRPASADAPGAPLAIAPAGPTPAVAAKPATPAGPQIVAAVQTDQDRAPQSVAERVSQYWNAVQMLSGTFVQVDPDGSRKTGDFYMQKPGRVRFEYDAPVPLELIANGQSVAVRDRKLNTQDITPLSQTPLRFLLAQNVDLARDPHVVGVYQDKMFVTVVMEEKVPMLGTYRLMLLFDAKDYTLKQWVVTDPQGYDTSVAIRNLDYTRRLDPKLFVINFDRMLQ